MTTTAPVDNWEPDGERNVDCWNDWAVYAEQEAALALLDEELRTRGRDE